MTAYMLIHFRVWTLNEKYEEMDRRQQALVYMNFIQVFLSRAETKGAGFVPLIHLRIW